MDLRDLKESIEDRSFSPSSMVIVGEDKFLPLQYLEELRSGLNYNLIYVESISEIGGSSEDIFASDDNSSDNDIYVLNTQVVDFCSDILYNNSNVIVVANKIEDDAKKFYKPLLMTVPKLEEWQIKDMVYSFGKGIDTKYLDWLAKSCNNDVNRLYQEMLKISIFPENERRIVFDSMLNDGAFDDISSSTIFNFTGSIAKKDLQTMKTIYSELDNIDVNEFGLLTILYTNFSHIFQIQLGLNPTPEKLGLKASQFNAIKYNCGKYSGGQLVKILEFLSGIDKRIKTGELPTNILRDYLVLSILSF